MTVAAAVVAAGLAWAEPTSAPAKTTVDLELKDVSVRDAIGKLFEGTGLKYSLEAGVSGQIVELKLRGITFEQALKSLADAADLTYKVTDGVYVIGPAKPTTSSAAAGSGTGAGTASATGGGGAASGAGGTESLPASKAGEETGAAPTTQVIVNQPTPVFYGHPPAVGHYGYPAYYGEPPVLRVGNVAVFGRYRPLAVIQGMRVFSPTGVRPPPPYGYVLPDVHRFLRNEYALTARPSVTVSYDY